MVGKNGEVAVHKLIILYFAEKAGAAVSNNQISQFALEFGYMDYFELQSSLNELCDSGYMEKTKQHNKYLYFVADEGIEALSFFHHIIPESAKMNINAYLSENRKKMQTELDVSANYFPLPNGEYLVKCALLEGSGELLMEIVLISAEKNQAVQMCHNWKNDTSRLYKMFTAALCEKPQ